MLIAVASKTGAEVDQHFGHAESFRIFKYHKGQPEQVSEVTVEKYCSFDPDHPFRHAQLNGIAEALKGCHAVVTAMIGELPKQEMEKLGFKVVTIAGPIGPALKMAHDTVCQGSCNGANLADKSCQYNNP
ncbi:MAG: dinitrogenase iron-molybdenum cofactor biosynthesis protein [Deltaproteobacteria bacterium]|jgi:predicted Fe-Mo cluster-binding NifX family protein|nr:dinitrogenase iron-molybdenum cofactor biosynthesis protein [Deltaproteobacteria bacterium]MBW2504836.1 dinitrogenase iron-molybdenum cofactor biosynthesis protein [Deltaproteobacteria bacterium]